MTQVYLQEGKEEHWGRGPLASQHPGKKLGVVTCSHDPGAGAGARAGAGDADTKDLLDTVQPAYPVGEFQASESSYLRN